MTGANLLIHTRFLLQEDSAAFFTDANLLLALNAALYKWAALLNKSNSNYYLTSAALSLSASANTVALPATFAGTCYYITDDDDDDEPLGKVPFSEIDPDASGDPENFCLSKAYVYFDKKPTSAKTYTIWFFAKPTAIANDAVEVDFPVLHHSLLAFEVAIWGRLRDKMSDITGFANERDKLSGALIEEMSDNIKGIPTVIRDSWPINADGD